MRPRRLLWHIFPPITLIVVLSLIAISSYASRSLREFHLASTTQDLAARAELVKQAVKVGRQLGDASGVDDTVKRLGRLTRTRITIIRPNGRVIADSAKNPAVMSLHDDRPEIIEALTGRPGASRRFSDTLQQDLLYVATPLYGENGAVVAVVRTALPLTALESALHRLNLQLAAGGLAIAAIAAAVSLFVSRRLALPIEHLQHAATRFASGDLSVRLPAAGSAEIAGLTRSLNQMAAQLDEHIRDVMEQRNEREAVLAGMIEAVIAVDRSERVTTINSAACEMLGVNAKDSLGRSIQEVARNAELLAFAADALASSDVLERDLDLHGGPELSVQAHGAPLRDGRGRRVGAVIVLNDVTRLRRLERIRRDFVANVSHELKTPITSVKGFIETLSDGAIDDPDSARRFLGIAARQADRLTAIIEDLLALSRIEQESEQGRLPVTHERVAELLAGALDVCRLKADTKNVRLELDCDATLELEANAPLLEQAIVNLVDNAVKYSEDGSTVSVDVRLESEHLRIDVSDQGCGIGPEHLPRLFERFYRVDKARSRAQGGTGLGLAIVKHIAQVHRGTITVDSHPGRGTRFSLRVPQRANARADDRV